MRLLGFLLLFPAMAHAAALPQLPSDEFADTEVSTNISFAVSFETMTRV